jgi:hypothetical protein
MQSPRKRFWARVRALVRSSQKFLHGVALGYDNLIAGRVRLMDRPTRGRCTVALIAGFRGETHPGVPDHVGYVDHAFRSPASNGMSIEVQLGAVERVAETNGWEMTWLADEGVSGAVPPESRKGRQTTWWPALCGSARRARRRTPLPAI